MTNTSRTTTTKAQGIYRQGTVKIGDVMSRADAQEIYDTASKGEKELYHVNCDHSDFWSPPPDQTMELLARTMNRRIPELPKRSVWLVEFTADKWNIKFRNMDFSVDEPVTVAVDLVRIDPNDVTWHEPVDLYTSLIATVVAPAHAMPNNEVAAFNVTVLQSSSKAVDCRPIASDLELLKHCIVPFTTDERKVTEYGDGLRTYVSFFTPILLALDSGRVSKLEILPDPSENQLMH